MGGGLNGEGYGQFPGFDPARGLAANASPQRQGGSGGQAGWPGLNGNLSGLDYGAQIAQIFADEGRNGAEHRMDLHGSGSGIKGAR